MADSVQWNAEKILERIRRGAERGVFKGANAIYTRIGQRMRLEAKTGETYQRRGVVHQASAPGEPPAVDTGRLIQSMHVVRDSANARAQVVLATDYAMGLELGTENTEARPVMRPVLEEGRAYCEQVVREEIAKALK